MIVRPVVSSSRIRAGDPVLPSRSASQVAIVQNVSEAWLYLEHRRFDPTPPEPTEAVQDPSISAKHALLSRVLCAHVHEWGPVERVRRVIGGWP